MSREREAALVLSALLLDGVPTEEALEIVFLLLDEAESGEALGDE